MRGSVVLMKHWSLNGVEKALQVVACLVSEGGAWDHFRRMAPPAG